MDSAVEPTKEDVAHTLQMVFLNTTSFLVLSTSCTSSGCYLCVTLDVVIVDLRSLCTSSR